MTAISKLQRRGIRAGRLHEHRIIRFLQRDLAWMRPRYPLPEVAWLFRNLASLLRKGLTLPAACDLLADQRPGRRMGMVAAEIQAHLEQGASVAQAFATSGQRLGRTALHMVTAGTAAGALEPTFTSVAELCESQWRMRKSLQRAVRLPIVIFIITTVIFMFLITFVLPRFEGLYRDAGATLPGLTLWVMSLSRNLKQQGWMIPIAVSLIIALVMLLRQLPTGRLILDRLVLAVPRIGPVARRMISARCAKTLGLLLKARVPMLEALRLTGDSAGNEVIARAFENTRASVANGDSVAASFAHSDSLPLDLRDLAAVGEAAGDLPGVLVRYAEEAAAELAIDTDGIGNTLEPFLVVALGGMIGLVIIAMYLPIFRLVTVIR